MHTVEHVKVVCATYRAMPFEHCEQILIQAVFSAPLKGTQSLRKPPHCQNSCNLSTIMADMTVQDCKFTIAESCR